MESCTDLSQISLVPDPVPPGATAPGQWWPPRWLDPGYLQAHREHIDILHVHFGFESVSVEDLQAVVEVLAAERVPLVVTVHDLENPHLSDQSPHVTRLGVLIGAATAVVTLTPGAARAVAGRWGVEPVVLPHPHLLPIDCVGEQRAARPVPVIGVHAKFLRANVDPWPVMDTLLAADGAYGSAALRLDVDENALTSPRAEASLPDRLTRYRAAGVDVRVHPAFTDDELVDYLRQIDLMVLPYRFGTHSGWLEACFDSGVRPVVPRCGFFGEQHQSRMFGFDRSGIDAGSLVDAVAAALRDVAAGSQGEDQGRREQRRQERDAVQAQLVDLYRCALARRNAA